MRRYLTFAAGLLAACGSPAPDRPPATEPAVEPADAPAPKKITGGQAIDVVLIVIDTLRADAASEAATPVLDSVAAAGHSVRQAWSSGTWTVPSVVSLFTGMPVRQHAWDLPTGKLGKYPALPEAPRLPVVLHDAGFETVGLYANPYLAEQLGFKDGFDTWRRIPDRPMPKVFAEHVAKTWSAGERHFAYLHLIGPHSPLRPSDEARERWNVAESWFGERGSFDIGVAKRNSPVGARAAYAKAYRAVIEDTDAIVGQLLDGLGAHRDHTLVVITSDHGELLGEHGKAGHGRHVWQGLTHVPLLVAGPGTPERLPETMSITEIPALITQGVGVAHTWPIPRSEGDPLVAQREGRIAMLVDERWRGVWDEDLDGPRYYDISTDPKEKSPLGEDHGLEAAKAAWEAAVPAGSTSQTLVTLDESTLHELEALGYVGQ